MTPRQSKYCDFCPAEPGNGPFRRNEPLSNFNNENSLGTWTLAVENNGSDSRSGSVVGFSITSREPPRPRPPSHRGYPQSGNPLETDLPIAPGKPFPCWATIWVRSFPFNR